MVPLSFASETFHASRDGALFHPATGTLLLADLHLEKASFFGRVGQYLPPYDSHATLARLADLAERTAARRVVCLGDNYHDSEGEARLGAEEAELLRRLAGRCDFIWVVGNHDPDLAARHGGRIVRETRLSAIWLRHNVGPLGPGEAEISGHFHPRIRIAARARRIRRLCFVRGQDRLVMPAFGALTGGMDAADPAIARALGHGGHEALVVAGDRLSIFPLCPADRSPETARLAQ